MATRIQFRRDTLANFLATNPVLASGEPAYERDTRRWKIGDGVTEYAALDYETGGGGLPSVLFLDDLADVEAPARVVDETGNVIFEGVTPGFVLTRDPGSDGYAFLPIVFPDYSNVYQPKGAPPDEWYLPQVILDASRPTVPATFPSLGVVHDTLKPDPTVLAVVNTVAASGSGTVTLPGPYAATMHDVTLTGNPTLVFPAAAAGARIIVLLRQDPTGGRTVTWPSATTVMQWPSGSPPALVSTANGSDLFEFVSVGGGRWRRLNHEPFGAAAPPAAAPTIRGSVGGNSGTSTATSMSVVLPPGIQTGDIGYLLVSRDGTPVTPHPTPTITGWGTPIEAPTPVGSITTWLFRKAMAPADSGATVTFTVEALSRLTMTAVIVAGGTTTGEVRSVLTDGSADLGLDLPGLTPGSANNLLVALAALRYATSTDPSVTPPAEWTELQDHDEGRTAVINFGGWAGYRTLSGQSGVAQPAVTATTTHNETDAAFTIAIPPA